MVSLWHIADNVTLCYGLELTASGTDAEQQGFASHAEAVSMVVRMLSETAASGMPNERNAATMGLVKVTAKLLLREAGAPSGTTRGGDSYEALLRELARELVTVFLVNFSYTLDPTYRSILHQAVAATTVDASVPMRAAVGARQESEQLLLDVLSHLFAQDGADMPSTPATTVHTALYSTLQALCSILQDSSKSLSPAVRDYFTLHASETHNSFALVLPPPLPAGAEEQELEEPEPEVEHDEELHAIAKPKPGAMFSFDDDLLGGWTAPTTGPATGRPGAAPVPAPTVSSGSLLDDLWLMDAPAEPSEHATSCFDMFGGSAVPLTAAKTGVNTAAHSHTAKDEGRHPPPIAPPAATHTQRRTSFFRDIYDEDDGAAQPTTTQHDFVRADPASQKSPFDSFQPSGGTDFAPSAAHTGDGFAMPTVAAGSGQGFDWPGASSTAAPQQAPDTAFGASFAPSAAAGDGFSVPATTTDWPGLPSAGGFTMPPTAPHDDGFAPTTAAPTSASDMTHTAWPAADNSTATAEGTSTISATENGFSMMPARESRTDSVSSTGEHPPAYPHVSAPGSIETLSKEQVAAIAAAKRASRRVSVDTTLAHSAALHTVGGSPPPSAGKAPAAPAASSTNSSGWPEAVAAPQPGGSQQPVGSGWQNSAIESAVSPSTAEPAPTFAVAATPPAASLHNSWGEIPEDFGFGASPAGSQADSRRLSVSSVASAPVPGSLETLSKSDQAAIAAAKRARARHSIALGAPLTATAAKSGVSTAADPFFNAPAPTLAPVLSPSVAAQDAWPSSRSDGFAAMPPVTATDPFFAAPQPTLPSAVAGSGWPAANDGFASTAPGASIPQPSIDTGDFQATPADFAPTPATAPYADPAAQGGYAAPSAYGYPANGYAAPAGYPGYDPQYAQGYPAYSAQYSGYPNAAGAYGAYPPSYGYPPAPVAPGAVDPQAGYYGQPYPSYPPAAGQPVPPPQYGYAYPPQAPAPNGAPQYGANGQQYPNGQW
jgi:hypothetical protein